MRVEDYAFPRETSTEIKEMLDNIRRILNNGGYVPQTVSAIPAWSGDDGEWVIYINGNEVRNYQYNSTSSLWEYGFPKSSKYGWGSVLVDTANSSATKAVSFGYTFQSAPVVLASFIGYSSSGNTGTIDLFDTGLTKMVANPYAISTTGFTMAVYSGDGSNFPGAYNMGYSWVAIG